MSDYTRHFSIQEMSCRCGCGDYEMDSQFLEKLEKLRLEFGKPMIISSAKRCPEWNGKVGGAPSSEHLIGKAVDILIKTDRDRGELVRLGVKYGFTGFGFHKQFLHLDIRPGTPRAWLY